MLLGGIDFLQLMRTHIFHQNRNTHCECVCYVEHRPVENIRFSAPFDEHRQCGAALAVLLEVWVLWAQLLFFKLLSFQFNFGRGLSVLRRYTQIIYHFHVASRWGALDGPMNVTQGNNILHVWNWSHLGSSPAHFACACVEWCLCFVFQFESRSRWNYGFHRSTYRTDTIEICEVAQFTVEICSPAPLNRIIRSSFPVHFGREVEIVARQSHFLAIKFTRMRVEMQIMLENLVHTKYDTTTRCMFNMCAMSLLSFRPPHTFSEEESDCSAFEYFLTHQIGDEYEWAYVFGA